MVVLIDTNVILDFMTDRPPFGRAAKILLQKCHDGEIDAFIAAHSIPNIFYILRKEYSSQDRKKLLLDVCEIVGIVEIGIESIRNVLLNNDFDDIEDGLQAECAKAINAEYIITRNIDDFSHSTTPAILPDAFLKKIDQLSGK